MGYHKQKELEDQGYEAAADGLLVEVGALAECPVGHGYIYDGGHDPVSAYKLANYRIGNGTLDIGVMSNAEFSAIIKARYDENSAAECCSACAKNASRD
jgi:hypothetical protein